MALLESPLPPFVLYVLFWGGPLVSLSHANLLPNHGTEQARDKASWAGAFKGFHKATRALSGLCSSSGGCHSEGWQQGAQGLWL